MELVTGHVGIVDDFITLTDFMIIIFMVMVEDEVGVKLDF